MHHRSFEHQANVPSLEDRTSSGTTREMMQPEHPAALRPKEGRLPISDAQAGPAHTILAQSVQPDWATTLGVERELSPVPSLQRGSQRGHALRDSRCLG